MQAGRIKSAQYHATEAEVQKYDNKKTYGGGGTSFKGHSGYFKADGSPIGIPGKRSKRCVWRIPTKPYPRSTFCYFPYHLIETPIKAGCPEGGVVLDPFMGSGTVAYVARQLGRNYVGIELNPEYIKLANQRLQQGALFAASCHSPVSSPDEECIISPRFTGD